MPARISVLLLSMLSLCATLLHFYERGSYGSYDFINHRRQLLYLRQYHLRRLMLCTSYNFHENNAWTEYNGAKFKGLFKHTIDIC